MTSWEEHVVPKFDGPGGRQSSRQGSAMLAQQHGQLWEESPLPAHVTQSVLAPLGNSSSIATTTLSQGGKLFSRLVPRLLRVVVAFQD